jgi:membrane protease YdiL (CAAX protease family)
LKKYFFPILFYSAGSIMLLTPVIFFIMTKINKFEIFNYIISIMQFKFDILTIFFLLFVFGLILVLDIFFFKDEEHIKKNIKNIEILLGEKNNILLNFILCIFTGFFEEILFRGYLYFLIFMVLNIIFPFIVAVFISIFIVSVLFGFLHITQGKIGFIMSALISVIFFVSIIISKTIWYAMVTHFIFNFIELSFVFPSQKKKYSESNVIE